MSVTAPDIQTTPTDPTLDFLGLFADQSEDVILARMIDWANEGLDPVADAAIWVDTREGGHWRTTVTPVVRELARLYDLAGTEVPMSGFVLWAWEVYLDDLAAVWDVLRKPATFATGVVTFSGPAGSVIDAGVTVGAQQTSDTDPAPQFGVLESVTIPDAGSGSGSVDADVQATVAGSAGEVSAGAITEQGTPLPAGVTFTNAAATLGGNDVETDDSLRKRVLDAIAGKGPGNVQDYVRWAGGWPGVGRVSVVPVWNGAGTVLVMVSDPDGLPLPSAIVSALQADLDPVAGQGAGTAPVGATVTVDTSTLLNIAVDATLTFLPGFSWDGSANTTAVGPGIQARVVQYFLRVPPGGTVRQAHVAGIFATWPGVDNATTVKLNGATADVAVGLTPPKVPTLTGVTIH